MMKQKLLDPQQWNMYAYVRNNPLGNVDADGQACTALYMKSGETRRNSGETRGRLPRLLRLRLVPNLPHFCRMGRIGRVVAVGEAHHITNRGIARQPIFHSDQARSTYLHLLGEQATRFKLRLLGYCLMTNHVHWLAVPEHPEALARTVRFVHGPYAQHVNTSTRRNGHFWQNKFYSCPVENSAVGSVLAYIELNPVRAGLCKEAGQFR